MIPSLTNSEMASYTACRRGWWLKYYRCLQRLTHYSLPTIGTMYHHGLEHYYGTGDTNVSQMIRDEATALADQFPSDAPQVFKDAEYASIMLDGYFDWLEETGADAGMHVIAAEQSVEVPLGETGFKLRGKIDAIMMRESDSALLQLEHKTTGDLAAIPKYAQSAPQFLTYDLLAYMRNRESGEGSPTDGVIINMARRVKRTAKAKPPFYGRFEVRHNVEELRAHYRHVVAIGRGIQRTRQALDNGANHHDVCPPFVSRNHTYSCDCAPITSMFDDGSDVEGYLGEMYVPYDPYARYEETEK